MEKLAYFRIRFNEQIQYKAAALAGICTQFAFGAMYIMINLAFMKNSNATDMTIRQMVSYVWLGQAFLEIVQIWGADKEILGQIKTGKIVMDLVKPVDVYNTWFFKTAGRKIARVILRFIPLVIITMLPIWGEYSLMIQTDPKILLLFFITLTFSFLINLAYMMLVYAVAMIFVNAISIRQVFQLLLEIGSGLIIPIPFMPEAVVNVLKFTPFYYIQNISFNIYTGYYHDYKEIFFMILMQMFWIVVLIGTGKLIVKNRLKKLVVQGG